MSLSHHRRHWSLVVVSTLGILIQQATFAADTPLPAPTQAQLDDARAKGIEFLKTAQADDGSWTTPNAPGISGLVILGLLRAGVDASDAHVAKGIKFLADLKQADGGIYHPKSNHRNYETCIAILVFEAANKDGKYDELLAGADKYIRGQQWDEEEIKEKDPKSDPAYGGAGYGSKSRPDLSNTQFLIEALKAGGAKDDDPALQKALLFVSRCQNLESEYNNTPFAAKVNDGGFYYTPAAGGASMAGEATPNGGLRSYASMTYAGLKSMLYAGVKADDPRVKAATTWIKKFYSITENPGMGETGLFYYYHTFSKALHALGKAEFVDAEGKKHDWRSELINQLASTQKPNGSWVNSSPRWGEGDPNLVTGYALIVLSYCEAPLDSK